MGRTADGTAQGLRIVLAEDDGDLRDAIAAVLRASGADVLEVGDGLCLLAVILVDEIDVVVTDLDMPGANGGDVFRHQRSWGDARPFVIVTGSSDAPALAALAAEGAVVLTKPVAGDVLLRAIDEALGSCAGLRQRCHERAQPVDGERLG
jgi:two-component system, NtrC family, C4-dicarboxylate transport response regulator DctD